MNIIAVVRGAIPVVVLRRNENNMIERREDFPLGYFSGFFIRNTSEHGDLLVDLMVYL